MSRNCDTLFVPDQHVPWHDRRRFAELLSWARSAKPRRIVHIGDLVDSYNASRFGKRLDVMAHSRAGRERAEAGDVLAALAKIAPVTWLAGNHEERLLKRGAENPAMADYLANWWPDLARQAGVRFVSRGYVKERRLLMCHGEHGNWPVRAEAKARKRAVSVFQGHTHQLRLDWLDEDWYAVEIGHLVAPKSPVFEYAAGVAEGIGGWVSGFGWTDTTGVPHVERL